MIVNVLNRYFLQYAGVPNASWKKIIASLINSLAEGVIFFLPIFLHKVLKLSMEEIGFLISCYGLGTVLGGIAGGVLCDKIKPEIVSIVSLIIRIACFLVLIKVTHVKIIMITLFVLGLASYSFMTSNKKESLRYCEESYTQRKVLSILYATSNLGIGLSAFMIGWISKLGFDISFYFSAMLMLVCALYLFIIDATKESRVDNKNLTFPKNSCISPASNQMIKKTKSLLYIVGFCLFLLGLMASLRGSVYSVYLSKSFPHLGLHWLGMIFMLNPIIVVLFQTPVANFIDKKNKLLIMGWGIFLYGIGSFVLSFASVFSLAILSCVILTIGEMLSFATIPLIFYKGGDEDSKGRYIGLSQSIYGISVIVGPTLGASLTHI